MGYDWDAHLDEVRGVAWSERPTQRGRCCSCAKEMYKTPVQLGEATEWRHASTGRPLSWMPQKHTASVERVRPHAHRWSAESGSVTCTVVGCDSQTILLAVESEQERRVYVRVKPRAVSRRRAALAGS